jgi:transcription initiation factor TFIIIB Brf1 subunit/transcription initiation factor TFIIB
MSHQILSHLSDARRGGRNPFILTGAVIYLADWLLSIKFKQKRIFTQRIVSEATNIAEYSIRDHFVNLLEPIFLIFLIKNMGSIFIIYFMDIVYINLE